MVEVNAHSGANLAKFCAVSKQPFALLHAHSRAMEKPSVVGQATASVAQNFYI